MTNGETVRLTVGQAVVRFLARQRSERDGVEQPLFAGCFGIFGHGNVAGVGQALLETADDPEGAAVLPGPQRAGHGARGRRLRPDAQPADHDGLHGLGRPRLDQHAHRCRAGHGQPAAGAAAAQRRVRHPGGQPGAAGAGGPGRGRRVGQRRVPPGVPVLRPGVAPRAAARGAAGRDAGADRPGARPARSPSRCPRTSRPRRTTGRSSCSPSGCGTSRGPGPSRPRWRGPSS